MTTPPSAKAWNAGTYAKQDNMQRVVPEKWQAQAYWWLRGYDGHSWYTEDQPTQIVAHVTEAQRVAIMSAYLVLIDDLKVGRSAVLLENALRAAGILKD